MILGIMLFNQVRSATLRGDASRRSRPPSLRGTLFSNKNGIHFHFNNELGFKSSLKIEDKVTQYPPPRDKPNIYKIFPLMCCYVIRYIASHNK